MCRVDLNHTTLPCSHRWYHLLSSCTATASLSTCSGPLAIQGWEIKCDFCPFCAGWDLSSDDFMLLGGGGGGGGSGSSRSASSSLSSAGSAASGSWSGVSWRVAGRRHGSVSSSAASVSSADAIVEHDSKLRSSVVGGYTSSLGVPLSRQPSLALSVSVAREARRSSSISSGTSGAANASYEPAGPVLGALEKNLQMNARINGYMDELPQLKGGKRSKSRFRRRSKAVEPQNDDAAETQDFESSTWKRRSRSIVGLVTRR